MKIIAVLLAVAAMLSACTPPQSEPIVTDYNGHSVKVFEAANNSFTPDMIVLKAQEVCANDGKNANYQSTAEAWGTDSFNPDKTHLFICS